MVTEFLESITVHSEINHLSTVPWKSTPTYIWNWELQKYNLCVNSDSSKQPPLFLASKTDLIISRNYLIWINILYITSIHTWTREKPGKMWFCLTYTEIHRDPGAFKPDFKLQAAPFLISVQVFACYRSFAWLDTANQYHESKTTRALWINNQVFSSTEKFSVKACLRLCEVQLEIFLCK